MTATRLTAAGRRASILAAAKGVFARYGLEGACTQQIARAAGVSEALLFRHFSSKTHIYRAVLRDVIVDQNRTFGVMATETSGTRGLLVMIEQLIDHAMQGSAASNAEGMRMVVGSLAGDGNYARLVYRRALRLSRPQLERALVAAQKDGGLPDVAMSPTNIIALLEHVGTMIMMARCHTPSVVAYDESADRLRTDAILFCARGLGISREVVSAFLRRG